MFPRPLLVPRLPIPSPESAPAILTEEGAAVEADGGLAGHLHSIKDCIIELVRKGEGLQTAGGRLRVRGSLWKLPLDISFLSPVAVQDQDTDCPRPLPTRTEDLRFQ